MKHLYIQTAFLGDLLLSIPALKRIRVWDPQSHITLLCRQGLGEVVKNLRLCDKVIEVDKKSTESLQYLDKFMEDNEYDYLFCPHQSMRSYGYVKKIKAKNKIGYKKIWNTSFTNRVRRNLAWPEALRQLQLISLVDKKLAQKIEDYSFSYSDSTIHIPDWLKMTVAHLAWSQESYQQVEKKFLNQFSFQSSYVCVAPGSVWPTKMWREEEFVKVSTSLVREGQQVVILGAPNERDLCERIQRQIPKSVSMAGNLSIWESMMVLNSARALVCNDSGAMHMAAVVGTPTVSIFGPTVQELGYRPWSTNSVVIENKELLCRPCGQHGSRHCPIGTHDCMKSVEAGHVLEALAHQLKSVES